MVAVPARAFGCVPYGTTARHESGGRRAFGRPERRRLSGRIRPPAGRRI
ncbi:hypothetical protein HMPREF9440_00868 [Sutterella parvirubra YIT 11816]|uniref:Uncharacterized protein n=1 Tax=Sutterella parvirubra YIT 11816 TaxID=762967 RepID=H3KDQ7_9BURK|nr:hypothetical protein HMPREF9440_00868 [Sutterella parvirubra YIT 11816]